MAEPSPHLSLQLTNVKEFLILLVILIMIHCLVLILKLGSVAMKIFFVLNFLQLMMLLKFDFYSENLAPMSIANMLILFFRSIHKTVFFYEIVSTLSLIFGQRTPLLNIRDQCFQIRNSSLDDHLTYSSKVNRDCKRFKVNNMCQLVWIHNIHLWAKESWRRKYSNQDLITHRRRFKYDAANCYYWMTAFIKPQTGQRDGRKHYETFGFGISKYCQTIKVPFLTRKFLPLLPLLESSI